MGKLHHYINLIFKGLEIDEDHGQWVVKEEKERNEEGEAYWKISRKKRVTIKFYKGQYFVDIREFYEKDGRTLPGKKGLFLSIDQW
jgi:hypothetical protein